MLKVFVVGGDYGVRSMYLKRGWELAQTIDETVNVVQFTGGADVDPSYYGEPRHPATRSYPERDAKEAAIFHEWVGKVPFAGICRGAQFLNVMNGGSMWQDVGGHARHGTHEAFCHITDTVVDVTSTHHQMMIPTLSAKVLLTAKVATHKSSWRQTFTENLGTDWEGLFYHDTQSLCFQPHPEYLAVDHPCQELYFTYLETFLLTKG